MMFFAIPIGLAVGAIGISTITNIQQTIQLQKIHKKNAANDLCVQPSLLSSYLTPSPNGPPRARVPVDKTTPEVVQDLKNMKRDELLMLFLSCDAPPEKRILGEWDGMLLEDNGPVLTFLSSFVSNSLFGRGRKWKGKAFWGEKTEGSSVRGTNRFRNRDDDQPNKSGIAYEHNFDYSLGASLFGKQSIRLNYSKYQSLLSPWTSMRDEVRVLKIPSSGSAVDKNGGVLIGFGWMAWSGGRLNCTPFCLVQSNENRKIVEK